MAQALSQVKSLRTNIPAEGRLDFLDALRGCAALAVVFQHSAQYLWPDYITFSSSIFDLGNFGVMLFFLCSGFIIPVSLERQGSLKIFWLRRLFRLFPLYWFCIAVSLLLAYIGWGGFEPDFLAHPWACGLANMTMLQTMFGCSNILGPAWSLMFEIVFYVIVSIQFRLGLISYSVYLIHPFVIYRPAQVLPPWLALLAGTAAVIPIAALTYYAIEARAIHVGRRLTSSRQAARRSQPEAPLVHPTSISSPPTETAG